jgi:hypothetical protein
VPEKGLHIAPRYGWLVVHVGVLTFLFILVLMQLIALTKTFMLPDLPRVTSLEVIHLICSVVITLVYAPAVFRWPVRASVSVNGRVLNLDRILRSSLELRPEDLRGYSVVDVRKAPYYIVPEPGLILYPNRGRPVQLRSQNLQEIAPIENLLVRWGIACLGEEHWPPPWAPLRYSFDRE